MSVYIDDYAAPFGRMLMCHMTADTDQELYDMADKIGIQRKWKHGNHFDVCLSKKKLAIEKGAIEITLDEIAKMTYLKKMRKHYKVNPSLLSRDLKNLKIDKNYYKNEKKRIRNETKY